MRLIVSRKHSSFKSLDIQYDVHLPISDMWDYFGHLEFDSKGDSSDNFMNFLEIMW